MIFRPASVDRSLRLVSNFCDGDGNFPFACDTRENSAKTFVSALARKAAISEIRDNLQSSVTDVFAVVTGLWSSHYKAIFVLAFKATFRPSCCPKLVQKTLTMLASSPHQSQIFAQ